MSLPTDPTGLLSFLPRQLRQISWKQPCRVATTADVTIATALNAGDVIDGITLVAGDRVLVKAQTTASQNGIYVAGPTPYRDYDMDQDMTSAVVAEEVIGAFVAVIEGSLNGGRLYRATNTTRPTVLGTTDIQFVEFSPSGGAITVGSWRWSTSTATPVTSRIGLATQPPVAGAAAVLQVHENDASGADRSPYFDRMIVGDTIAIDDGSGHVWQHVVTGAMTDNGVWRSIPITYDPRATVTLQPAAVACEFIVLRGGSAGGGAALTVEEADGSPTDAAITKIVFPNGTLGIASHVATYTPAGGGGSGTLTTVEEADGTPTDSAVTKLVVPNGSLAIASHVATITFPAGGGTRAFGLDRASFDATYGDDFDGASLAGKWSRHNQTSGMESYQVGGLASALRVAHGATNTAEYIYQTAPNGTNETWEASFSLLQPGNTTGNMFGIIMVTSAGTGVGAMIYDNGAGWYVANITSHAYASAAATASFSLAASPYYLTGGRVWLRLRKATGAYSTSYSFDGQVYSAETTGNPSAFTPTRIGVGRFLGTASNSVVTWHWFDKTA